MKFGLMQLVSGFGDRAPAQVYRNNLELVCLAEELGFDSTWVVENHFSDYGLVPNTLQYLAAAAVMTNQIRLGTAVIVTPLHNPLRIAEEIAFLDQLSEGRLEIGMGRGYQANDFDAFGLPIATSRDVFDDCVAFLTHAWTHEGPFNWHGPSLTGDRIEITLKPLQKPHPRLWMACAAQSTFERAGDDGWQIMTSPNFTPINVVKANFELYSKTLQANGYHPKDFYLPMIQMVYAGADEKSAYERPRDACMGHLRKLSSLLPAEVRDGWESYSQFGKIKHELDDPKYDRLYDSSSILFGSQQRLVDRISWLRAECGLNYLVGLFDFGALDHEMAKDSMRRFAEEVMPHFR